MKSIYLFFFVLFSFFLFSKSVATLSKNFETQNSLEKKITSFIQKKIDKDTINFKKEKLYSEVMDSFYYQKKEIHLVKYVNEKNWWETLYLVSIYNKKSFWTKKIKQKILWIRRLNSYGALVAVAKLKQKKNKLVIYTITETHKGNPSLELYEIPTNDFSKKSKLKILTNMKPDSKSMIEKIKQQKIKLDKEFNLYFEKVE